MTDPFYVGAYWAPRAESVQQCGGRFSDLLARLGTVHPVLGAWYEQGSSRLSAATPVDASADALTAQLAGGTNRRDSDRSAIPALGWSVAIWNGADDAGVALRVRCGVTNARMSNSVVVELPAPDDSAAAASLYTTTVASDLLEAVVAAWDPDWATVTSNALRSAQGSPVGAPVAGWLTYRRGRELVSTGSDPGAIDPADLDRVRSELFAS